MWQFILGSAGFLLYFIYDINSIKKKNAFLQKFFALGTVLVAYHSLWNSGFCGDSASTESEVCSDLESELWASLYFLYIPCFLPFPLKRLTVKKTNYALHILRVCTACAVIPEFCGSQGHIFACGECLVDGDRESIFYL